MDSHRGFFEQIMESAPFVWLFVMFVVIGAESVFWPIASGAVGIVSFVVLILWRKGYAKFALTLNLVLFLGAATSLALAFPGSWPGWIALTLLVATCFAVILLIIYAIIVLVQEQRMHP